MTQPRPPVYDAEHGPVHPDRLRDLRDVVTLTACTCGAGSVLPGPWHLSTCAVTRNAETA